jgi:hypothetical protein
MVRSRTSGFVFHVERARSLTGDHDEWSEGTGGARLSDQLDAVSDSKPIVDQVCVVAAVNDGFQPLAVRGDPLQLEVSAANLRERLAQQRELVLVVVDEQQSDGLGLLRPRRHILDVWLLSSRDEPHARSTAGSATISDQ